jgi:hypothetical protein
MNPLNVIVPLPQSQSETSDISLQFTVLAVFHTLVCHVKLFPEIGESVHTNTTHVDVLSFNALSLTFKEIICVQDSVRYLWNELLSMYHSEFQLYVYVHCPHHSSEIAVAIAVHVVHSGTDSTVTDVISGLALSIILVATKVHELNFSVAGCQIYQIKVCPLYVTHVVNPDTFCQCPVSRHDKYTVQLSVYHSSPGTKVTCNVQFVQV